MKKIILSMVAVAALSTAGFATVNNQTGCGLGSQIIKDDSSAVMLALQATTNGTSGNQTFGVTSGTSGCKRSQLVLNERAAAFVASNMDQLSREIAIGKGESVETLAELLNVENKAAFASALQANYNAIYANEKADMATVLDNVSTIAG
ncbi:MAG: DUF3015 domain-containing protein [Sulfuricurvum sp.]|jgi:hypothetical protein|uniref:DUF3015 family protein n=1 Tax=Sulfuricurvum sp. TaxID=2025608 RepID=UPI0026015365|nr:DUF3015 family protein [Sulfuricurvum sp.]MCK9373535.1 DUF3015 domain-containing protein [Sulfuricurvum sp.]